MPRFETPDQRIRRLSQELLRSQTRSEKIRNKTAKYDLERQFARQQRDEDIRNKQPTKFQSDTVRAYANTPPEERTTFKAIRKTAVETDPVIAAGIAEVEERDRRRMTLDAFGGQPVSQDIRATTPAAIAAAEPVPITQAETFAARGPAFDPNDPRIRGVDLTPTEAAGLRGEPSQAGQVSVGALEALARLTNPAFQSTGQYLPGEAFERGLERTRNVPVVGRPVANAIELATSPAGILSGVAAPVGTAGSFATGAALGSAGEGAEELGAPQGTGEVAELAGQFVGPLAIPAGQLAAQRIGTNLGQAIEREGGLGGLLASEAGGTKLTAAADDALPPATWETAAQKLVGALKQTPQLRKVQEAQRTTERSQRIGAYQAAFDKAKKSGADPQDAFQTAKKALGGELPFAEFAPAEGLLSADEARALWQRAAQWEPPKGFGFRKVRLGDAMQKIMVEGKLPQENEVKLLRQVFGDDLADEVERAATDESTWNYFLDATGIPKAFLSSFDLSVVGRQNILTAFRHPFRTVENIGTTVRSFGSKAYAEKVMQSITDDVTPVVVRNADGTQVTVPYGEVVTEYAPAGTLRDVEAPVSARQQSTIRRWLKNIPGISASQRAFATGGNKIRSDVAKYWINRAMAKDGFITQDRLDAIFNLSQRLTGQGTLGPPGKLTDGIAALGWSPFYRIAPLQVTASLFHKDPLIRRMAAEYLVSFVGGGATILAGLKASGLADVEDDPRSSDFGKIRIGDQRINFWGTNQLLARSVAQIATGERKSLDSGLVFPAKPGKTVEDYLRSGLAPEWALLFDLKDGKTAIGRDMDLTSFEGVGREAFERMVPLVAQDIAEAVQREGLRGGLIAAPLATFGIGVQTFGPSPRIELDARFKDRVSDKELAWAEDLMYYSELKRAELREKGVDTEKIPTEASIRKIGREYKVDPKIVEWAILLRPGTKTRDILTGKFAEEAQRELEAVAP